jgi:hypothetical protein
MTTVAALAGMSIMVFHDDHEPPHLHVEGASFSAKLDLTDLAIGEAHGTMRSADIRQLRAWARRHQAELWDSWLRARAKRPLRKIEA